MEEIEKTNILDAFNFAEWVGKSYVRLEDAWVFRYGSNIKESENLETTEELWILWYNNYR